MNHLVIIRFMRQCSVRANGNQCFSVRIEFIASLNSRTRLINASNI